ncbi:cell division protein FtsK [Halosimplex carlsbadense 2-9-1]|uniref:Cell division protein FtsK n=2 Tax=Halosimplex carlsbadense TaxID=171164 RepID=M0CC74_9EURY|nr:cell division protein FtsK [Halosimplex carlsbadense 2-9-1]
MLVGGTTGSGKTVFLYSLLTCFLKRFEPEELRLAIVDPKLTNFMFFNQLPNLEHDQVITEDEDAAELFEWITSEEIPRRTQVLGESGSIDIQEHNERSDEPLRPLVVVIDEYADLIDGLGDLSDEFETNVRRIAQKARSVGIHLVISTQRPSAKIIDTDLRANLDMRVAFRLPSASDSQVILDESGAEGLGGNGDMLFKEADSLTRLQGIYVDTDYLRDLIGRISE